MSVKQMLREYPQTKKDVDAALERIQVYKNMLGKSDIEDYITCPIGRELGMPIVRRNVSPIEIAVEQKHLDAEQIKVWIAEEKSRIARKCFEIQQIEISLEALTESEKEIIKLKYFKKWKWNDIEIHYNKTYRKENEPLTYQTLFLICKKCLQIISEILEPYMRNWKVCG